MPDLVRATGDLLERVLGDTYDLWGDGLGRRAYARWNEAQERTPWGGHHLRRFALVDGDRLLASAKRYDLTLRLDGRLVPTLGIGAVFTPQALRGRGYARAIVAALEARALQDGAQVSLLFSEIGTPFYERLGYRQVPVTMADLEVDVQPGAPAIVVRSGEDRDAEDLASICAQRGGSYRLSLACDADQVRYSVAKKRLLAGLDLSGRRALEFHVVEEGHHAVAFVLIQVSYSSGGPDRWSVAACGDRDPDGARIGALLQVLLARAPYVPHPLIRAWWPMALRPPQLRVTAGPPPAEVMMVKPLVSGLDESMVFDSTEVLYWHGDAF
jgi:GNAT superfamily N-acetyltransferase